MRKVVPATVWSFMPMKRAESIRVLALCVACLGVGVGVGKWLPRRNDSANLAKVRRLRPARRRILYQFFDTLVDIRSCRILHNYVEPVDDDKLWTGRFRE